MKKIVPVSLLFLFLVSLIAPVYASITGVLINDSLEERLVNSPILVLCAIVVINIIALIYRKVRK